MTLAFDVLNPQQKIYGNFFLEASAGTGKTFTIAHLVVRLICESSPPIPISKIGVVTFTKAAAFELKTRIKELLIKLKEDLENDLPTFIDDKLYDKKELIFRLKGALLDFDFAPISTIHGFCFQILKKHAPFLNLKPHLQSQDDTSIEAICYDHIKQFLKSETQTSCLCKKQKEALLASKKGDLHALILSLKQLILSGIELENLPSWDTLKKEIKDSLKETLPDKQELFSYINRYKLSPVTKQEVLFQLESLYKNYRDKDTLEELLFKKPFWDFLCQDNLKVKLEPSYSYEAENFFNKFKAVTAPLIKKALQPAYLELKLASVCKNSFEKILEDKHIVSFSSMLKILDEALNQVSSSYVRQDFETMIVDEFQDTDPVQWSILKKLFVDHPVKAFYMVGDPKQAIYAFRSADVYTYIQAKNQCPNLNVRTLETCFRSSSPFIESLNLFLSKVTWLRLPFVKKAYPYQKVKSSDKQMITTTEPFTFYTPAQTLEDAEILTKNIALFLHHTYPEDTIAILVKDRFQLERIENHLKTAGAVYHSLKNEYLEGSQVFNLIDELLVLLDEPLNKGNLNRFMASSWLNYDLLDFEASKQKKIIPIAFALCQNLKLFFKEHGFIATLEHLLDLSWPDEKTSFRILITSLYGHSIIDQLFDIALTLHNRSHFLSQAALIRVNLHILKKENVKLTQVPQKTPPIHLLTSHMSKGLEYDHVIALGIATRYEKTPDIILKRNDEGAYLGPFFHDEDSFNALHDLDMEKLRQLYVAITRAKKSCHIPQIAYPMDDLACSLLSPLEFYILLIKYPDLDYKELYTQASHLNLKEEIKNIFHEPNFCHKDAVVYNEKKDSYISIPVLDKSRPIGTFIKEKILSFSSLKSESEFEKTDDPLKGRDFGDFFHKLMEDLITSGRYLFFEDLKTLNYYSFLIEMTPFKEYKNLILDYLKKSLQLPLAYDETTTFCLKDIPLKDLYVEKAFSYYTELGMMKGVIDCCFVYKNHLFFIDWKTSFLKNVEDQALEEHMKKASYDLQLDIYKNALILQKNYFKNIPLKKAFYIFVKQGVIYEKTFEELQCSH